MLHAGVVDDNVNVPELLFALLHQLLHLFSLVFVILAAYILDSDASAIRAPCRGRLARSGLDRRPE